MKKMLEYSGILLVGIFIGCGLKVAKAVDVEAVAPVGPKQIGVEWVVTTGVVQPSCLYRIQIPEGWIIWLGSETAYVNALTVHDPNHQWLK